MEAAQRWEEVAARQQGVIARTQAVECGLSRYRIEGLLQRGAWVRVHPSVYRSASAPVLWPQALMAATLWAEGRAVVSHRAAAALWGLGGFWRSHLELSSLASLSVPAGLTFHQVRRLDAADLSRRSGIATTTVARTLLDLAGVVPERTLARALDEAVRRNLTTLDQVQWCVDRNGRRGREGVGRLTALLARRQLHGVPDSSLETEADGALGGAGVPAARCQYRVVERGRFLAEVDFAWPLRKVALQVHSSAIHRQASTWEKDQATENQLAAHGWFVVKATDTMLRDDPDAVTALLRRALAERGDPLSAPAPASRRSARGSSRSGRASTRRPRR